MNQIMIWKDIDKLEVKYEPGSNIPDDFVKLSCSNENVFLLAKDNTVWFGKVDSNMGISLKQVQIQAVDIACYGYYLYYTNESGQVFRAFIDNLELQDEVVLHEDAKSCVHGYITASQHISVKHIEAGGMGILYLSESGQLWASGDHPQLDIHNEDGPKKVSFFEGRHVISLACGKDFNCVVVHKRDDHCPVVNGDLINDDSEVFISACPQCTNENIISPLSPQSECPLGVKKHSNESISISTSTSKNVDSEDKKSDNGNSSSSTEGDSVHRLKNNNSSNKNIDDDTDSEIAEEEKGDRMSRLLMNTEAARQFFTRQLSWMSSGGEELLAEVSGPTKIIKKNMTTMASLVYEGVKTVGDKVATLSRHVSGGSDNNSDSFEEFVTDDLNPSSTSSVRCEWSCSGAYSDVSDRGAEEKLVLYLNRGSRLIKTEVWTWGNTKHGQLGTGDTVGRNKPVVVYQLTHVGTMRVECGWSHCAAVTLTGRCAVWGRNDMGQVCEDTKGTDQSSPIIWGRTSQAVTGSRHTLLLAPDNTLHWLGKHRPETLNSNNTELDVSEYIANEGSIPLRVLSSSDYSACLLGMTCTEMTSNSDLANEQCFLEEMINVHTSVVKPLSRKSCLDDFFANLCSRYTDLIHFTALNVATLYQGIPSCVLLQTHTDEHLLVYERYLSAVCDVTAMSGFAQMARCVDIPQKLIACFSDRLPSRKTSPENVLTFAFVYPLSRISFYKMMLSRGSNEVSPEFQRWEAFCEAQEVARKQAEATRLFWENSGRLVDTLRTPQRRLLRDSKAHPLTIYNASRFSNHWLILLSDSFVHISGANQNIHSLDTLWVEPLQDSDAFQNALLITTPEDTLTLIAQSACDKMEWLHAFQDAIKTKLNKNPVPTTRTASYTFTKHATYKDAKYTGRWVSGKLEGKGRLEWPDGKFYIGQFHCSQPHGVGRLEIPGVSTYEGFWKDGLQNGHGCTKYENGDVYEGYFKDGVACGYGVHKSGHFMTSSAYTYFGEWVSGQKQGYGVMDDIITGEKYMGCWNNNMKNGNGVIITRDGIYYEGIFSQNDINGQALMVFEDGSYYEGEMRTAGVFNGKGTLVFASGDKLEGSMYGSWSEGIKITPGILHKLPSAQVTSPKREKPKMFGKLSTPPNQKWKAIFRQCWVSLGASPDGRVSERDRQRESQRAWDNIAAALSSPHASSHRHNEKLLIIPDFDRENLDVEGYKNMCSYLKQAFESSYHPMGIALSELTKAYNNTYGVVCDHSYLLLQHAVEELNSIIERLYQIIRLLFPALPTPGEEIVLGDEPSDVVSMVTLLHPVILPRICSELFDLYTLDNKQENDAFRKRLLELNQHPDSTLMAFLDIDRKFWMNSEGELRKEKPFCTAIETLQLLKTTFVPLEKFVILQTTFKRMEDEVNERLGEKYLWTTDRIIPLLEFVIIRSQILHLASEVRFMADFMEERFKHGEFDFYFTNLNACYEHILEEKRTTIVR